jgi:deoxyribose-phosphate aldolase
MGDDINENIEDGGEEERFEFASKVDLHSYSYYDNLVNIIAIASEHSFRGVAVTLDRIDELSKIIKNNGTEDLIPIALVDFPMGSSPLDVRNYSIMAAREHGAREVEIVVPYQYVVENDSRKIAEDANNIVATAKKCNVALKYIFDPDFFQIDNSFITKLCRIIGAAIVPIISINSWGSDKTGRLSDEILSMRNIKSKSGCQIKANLYNTTIEDITSYMKAGSDIIGLKWQDAPNLVHHYEDLVQNKSNS